MAPTKANAAFVWRQFIDLGRSNPKKSKRYRCRHCQKDFAATAIGRPKEHLAACEKWQGKQQQERQAQDEAGHPPPYSEAIQKKITEVGVQHISQDESHSFAYDAAAPSACSRAAVGIISSLALSLAGSLLAALLSREFSPTCIRNSSTRFSNALLAQNGSI
ncbi:transposase [Pochonia chlamydosporia 170]|uniref:Transposase n=1 Tax=Pochonia chlamydosporia 170 TaxID=1380566 RepID=A0A219AR32_METCM|nr:transposase [Pochonia chlamydosporia 170]OWT43221.1 transposase [Pochonia chlamydosporia 170]